LSEGEKKRKDRFSEKKIVVREKMREKDKL